MKVYAKDGKQLTVNIKYTETIANHFNYHHIVDDHNNLMHQMPSTEKRNAHIGGQTVYLLFY